eukprot:TRINITY_DN3885_c0_g1_i1.p1 TRINITY_DN3885_c0_g1~~TRINITY_DN3885_c0_g1_i1.p1  ORF type:complete len:108 (-),score=3.10 TRINITY_DN3885_c0_g1_i1:159-482(-)
MSNLLVGTPTFPAIADSDVKPDTKDSLGKIIIIRTPNRKQSSKCPSISQNTQNPSPLNASTRSTFPSDTNLIDEVSNSSLPKLLVDIFGTKTSSCCRHLCCTILYFF